MGHKKKSDTNAAGSSVVKRTKYLNADNDDDDDDIFEVVPYRPRSKNASIAIIESEEVCQEEGSDQRRVSPKWLVDVLQRLNPRQKKAVEELGFVQLFHLQVDSVPAKIVSWCLDKFLPVSCNIQLPNNTLLHIAAEDVYLIFGFPKGGLRIDMKSRTQDKEITEEWAGRFEKKKCQILPSDVVSAMLAEVEGGDWFKRLFLILVEACLFENAADGYVKPKIMDILRDLTKIRKYDWCDHMITSLLRAHDRWLANNNKKFTGPSVFLVIFYVDRLVHYRRTVDRTFPLIRGWTTAALRARQRDELRSVGFGHGFLDVRFEPHAHLPKQLKPTEACAAEPSNDGFMELEEYTHLLIDSAKQVADTMSFLMNLISRAPTNFRQSAIFNNVIQSSSALIGITLPAETSTNEDVNSFSQRMVSQDWGSAEWQTSIGRMMEVFAEKQRLESDLGMPSFSLGLTQVPKFSNVVDTQTVKDGHLSVEKSQLVCVAASDAGDLGEHLVPGSEGLNDGLDFVAGQDIQDQPLAEIATMDKAYDAIIDVAENLNVDHFMDELVDPNLGGATALQSECGISVAVDDKAKPLVTDETVDDIVNVMNAEPVILETQFGVQYKQKSCVDETVNVAKRIGADDIAMKLEKGKGEFNTSGKSIGKAMGVPTPADDCKIAEVPNLIRVNNKGKAPAVEVKEPVHKMTKRTATEKKKATTMLSPFHERAVSMTAKLTTQDKEMYQWLISHSDGPEDDLLFNNKNVVAMRSDLQTLKPHTYLTVAVVDAWTCHLNFQERLRSQDSPNRFFFTTFLCSFCVVDTPLGWSSEMVRTVFLSRMEAEIDVARDFKLGNLDMVFFPICHSLHFYVLVLDLKRRMIVILDNSSSQADEPLTVKYGKVPATVVQLFCGWMIENKFSVKGRSMKNMPIQRLKLPWSNETNKVDCGVYTMRHMETYMGQRGKDWNIGLQANSDKLLQALRVKYCNVLLTTEANHISKENMNRVEAWFKGFRHVHAGNVVELQKMGA